LKNPFAGKSEKIELAQDSLVSRIYEKSMVQENYGCGYGLNPVYQDRFNEAKLKVVGWNNQGGARVVELPSHDFFIACLFYRN